MNITRNIHVFNKLLKSQNENQGERGGGGGGGRGGGLKMNKYICEDILLIWKISQIIGKLDKYLK